MDPLTHTLLTRRFDGKQRRTIACGLVPDAPFYAVYPACVIARGQLRSALTGNAWPEPPRWLTVLHYASHSLPVAVAGAVVIRVVTGRRPRRELAAWTLHILVDVPTHRRDPWGPRFLWPLADIAVDGWSWVDGLVWLIRQLKQTTGFHRILQR
ncbi:MAG: hypothetical protein FOGNACKC_06229 [Anaerolineae bacterium]|nr:hypothetical protein [Anaerolineae bacterium]